MEAEVEANAEAEEVEDTGQVWAVPDNWMG